MSDETPLPSIKIGWLISQLEASERVAQRFQANPATMPGIDRIEHLCDARFDGAGLTAANIRKLRVEVCKKLKWNSEQAKCADGLTLNEIADVLEGIQRIPFDVNWWNAVAAIAASQWAWDSHPLGNGHGQHRDAQAKVRIERGRNLQFKDIRFYSAKLPAQGGTFGVTIHDANNNQLKWGVGRQYYVPTADDLAIVQELYPNADPENPSWVQIETDLILAGKDKKELPQHNAATLIRLLQQAKAKAANVEPPAPPAGANADEGTDSKKTLPPSREKAYRQHEWAVQQNAALDGATDRAVYDWLKENLEEPDDLPNADTFSTYLTEARRAYGTQKHLPRRGRAKGKSVVDQDQL